ncbi:chlorocatechol 1,2-dioxygenase-like [Paramacrobiotus metropolitanus]|uniref:chlorocatechol 1,2-dioxygenase-like n=1 Tax=Paramacrobiotus metropolitanus TaxID=2943436 RepID=UPI0024460E9E|nr:chlorocatechol 1,2-dioxygenase-like [Paramacrobiotus metropolitanus]
MYFYMIFLVLYLFGMASTQNGFAIGSNGQCMITTPDVLGPYYKPSAPLFNATIPSDLPSVCFNNPAHTRLFVNGTVHVVDTEGNPCGKPAFALMDVWQADANGEYSDIRMDKPDYWCRTRFTTTKDGFFSLSTVFPGRYNDDGYRPAHLHFRITLIDENGQLIGTTLTTQLYFERDFYLPPNDSCQRCGSRNPSQRIIVNNDVDIKTFTGTWNVFLRENVISGPIKR